MTDSQPSRQARTRALQALERRGFVKALATNRHPWRARGWQLTEAGEALARTISAEIVDGFMHTLEHFVATRQKAVDK